MKPSITFRTVPPAQRAHSAAWMREWALDESLQTALASDSESTPPANDTHDGAKPASWPKAPNPFAGPFPAPGQIGLLPPMLTPGVLEPVYVGILSDWENDLLLIAPFSGFLHPATRGEWLTGRPEPSMAVLCPWSAVSVLPFLLAQSWHVGDFSPPQLEAAWQVFRHAATGEPLPEDLQDQVGAPIIHPLDPRIRYQRQLSARLATLKQRTAGLLEQVDFIVDLPWLKTQTVDDGEYKLAAQATTVVPHCEIRFTPKGHSVDLRITLDTDGQHCSVAVLGKDDRLSTDLDDAVIVAAEWTSPPIHEGQVRVPVELLRHGFCLRLADGHFVTLKTNSTGGP